MDNIGLTIAISGATALILTPLLRVLAFRTGFVDYPNSRKLHVTPMPLLGGLAIYLGILVVFLIKSRAVEWSQLLGILIASSFLLFVGILDDRGLLHNQIKLLIAMPAAAILVILTGTSFGVDEVMANAFGSSLVWDVLDFGITLFWIVGITAAFSILDHMDGLCAGVAAIASLFLLIFSTYSSQLPLAILAGAILGSSLGFLVWNFNPAKIFIGDGGAMFLGFMMASLSLKLQLTAVPLAINWLIPVLILGVPIFDTTLVSISRIRRGLIPFASPGKDHTAHRLSNLGLGQRGAVLVLYSLGGVFGLLAILVGKLDILQVYAMIGTLVILAVISISALERAPYKRQAKL